MKTLANNSLELTRCAVAARGRYPVLGPEHAAAPYHVMTTEWSSRP